MDPVSMVVAAVAAGAIAAAKDTASDAIKSTFRSLINLVHRGLGGDATAEAALKEFEKDPETWEKPLTKAVADHNLAQDDAVLSLAKELLKLIEEAEPSKGKYNIKIEHGQGIVIGDQADVTMSFGKDPPDSDREH